jgi:hypothetical protein
VEAEGGTLIGFDARVTGGAHRAGWTDARRESYLFRREVPAPLSVDRSVWPSVFDLHTELRPAYTGVVVGLFDRLDGLQAALRARPIGESYWIVACAVLEGLCNPAEREAWRAFRTGTPIIPLAMPASAPTPVPAERDSGWTLLGFDVADLAGTSALTNMGFLPERENVPGLRERWAPFLNGHHLFDDPARARAFKDDAGPRAPEHVPFFVYGLWRVSAAENSGRSDARERAPSQAPDGR